jgi:hypothetical protein
MNDRSAPNPVIPPGHLASRKRSFNVVCTLL